MILHRNLRLLPYTTLLTNLSKRNFCSDNDFKKQQKVKLTDANTQQFLINLLKQYDIVLFMKGTPQFPRCGYSGHVVEILKRYGIFQYKSVNILQNPVLREQVKIFSKWPTYPQLFIKGQLIGGADIVSEMHKDSTLKQLLQQHNLI